MGVNVETCTKEFLTFSSLKNTKRRDVGPKILVSPTDLICMLTQRIGRVHFSCVVIYVFNNLILLIVSGIKLCKSNFFYK